tara:strand:+ start:786 stop:1034 length:249 start_codon:yes stop_codon:yes gene_type:complete
MLRDTIYSINLGLEEGRGSVQVRLTKDTGNVELTLFMENKGGTREEKAVMTFNSDVDLQALIETLRHARVANLKHKGYKVVM